MLGDDEVVAYATLARACWPVRSRARHAPRSWRTSALDLCRRSATAGARRRALNVLGWLYVGQDRFEGNGPLFEAALSTAHAVGDEHFVGDGGGQPRRVPARTLATPTAAALCWPRARSAIGPCGSLYSVAYMLDAAARSAASRGGRPRRPCCCSAPPSTFAPTIGVSVWGSQLERRERSRSTSFGPRSARRVRGRVRTSGADAARTATHVELVDD